MAERPSPGSCQAFLPGRERGSCQGPGSRPGSAANARVKRPEPWFPPRERRWAELVRADPGLRGGHGGPPWTCQGWPHTREGERPSWALTLPFGLGRGAEGACPSALGAFLPEGAPQSRAKGPRVTGAGKLRPSQGEGAGEGRVVVMGPRAWWF